MNSLLICNTSPEQLYLIYGIKNLLALIVYILL